MSKLLYIAGPYREKQQAAVELNIASARQCGVLAVSRGWYPIIPHSNTAGFHLLLPDIKDSFWLESTLELLSRCDGLLLAPGWKFSTGAVREHAFAVDRGMYVCYNVDELKWSDQDAYTHQSQE